MNILITGGSGLIGSRFIRYFSQQHSFTVTTRSVERVHSNFEVVMSMLWVNCQLLRRSPRLMR